MNISLTRFQYTPRSIMGTLLVDPFIGTAQMYTLEPAKDRPEHPAIQEGSYDLEISYSPRFGRRMIHVKDVPGREGILIHSLNRPEESLGCIGVGYSQTLDFIGNSRMAVDALFTAIDAALDAGENCRITIQDSAQIPPVSTIGALGGE